MWMRNDGILVKVFDISWAADELTLYPETNHKPYTLMGTIGKPRTESSPKSRAKEFMMTYSGLNRRLRFTLPPIVDTALPAKTEEGGRVCLPDGADNLSVARRQQGRHELWVSGSTTGERHYTDFGVDLEC